MIQRGIEVLMINHHVLSIFFNQLALAKFGGARKEKFSNPIDAKRTITCVLHVESKKGDEKDSMTQIKISSG